LERYGKSTDTSELELPKFQLCKNEDCAPGGDIGPTDGFSIKDVSNPATVSDGQLSNEWLTLDEDGMITKTSVYKEDTRLFTIIKSAAGKHCLGSADTVFTTKTQGKHKVARFTTAEEDASFTTAEEDKSCLSITKVDCPSVKEQKSNPGSPVEPATALQEN
jgi:hypothetical protein